MIHMSGLAPAYSPRGGKNLSQFQNTMTLSSPFLFHIPLVGHQSCREGTTAVGSTTTLQKGKDTSIEGEQYSQKQHFGEPDTSASCSLLRTT